MITQLRATFGQGVKTVTKHRGEWSPKMVQKYSRHAPALLVSVHGGDDFERSGAGTVRGSIGMSVAVMVRTTDAADGDHDDPALLITAALLTLIPSEHWDCTSGAEEIKWRNMSHEFVGLGVNVHVVSWVQPNVTFPPLTEEEIAALPDFLRAHTDFTPAEAGPDDPIAENLVDVRNP